MNTSIRKKGILKVIKGVLAGVAAEFVILEFESSGSTMNIFYLLAIATPAAYGLVGLLEIIFNCHFSELESIWMSLKAWQRGVIGLLIVTLSFILLFLVIGIAGYLELI